MSDVTRGEATRGEASGGGGEVGRGGGASPQSSEIPDLEEVVDLTDPERDPFLGGGTGLASAVEAAGGLEMDGGVGEA
jgi:hypothetical protein